MVDSRLTGLTANLLVAMRDQVDHLVGKGLVDKEHLRVSLGPAARRAEVERRTKDGETEEEIAAALEISRGTVQRDKKHQMMLPPEGEKASDDAFDIPLEAPAPRGERDILSAAKDIRAEKAKTSRAERVDRIAEISKGNAILGLERRYPIIYADPPWRYENPPQNWKKIPEKFREIGNSTPRYELGLQTSNLPPRHPRPATRYRHPSSVLPCRELSHAGRNPHQVRPAARLSHEPERHWHPNQGPNQGPKPKMPAFWVAVRFRDRHVERNQVKPAAHRFIDALQSGFMVSRDGKFEGRDIVEIILPHELRGDLVAAGQSLEFGFRPLGAFFGFMSGHESRAHKSGQIGRVSGEAGCGERVDRRDAVIVAKDSGDCRDQARSCRWRPRHERTAWRVRT